MKCLQLVLNNFCNYDYREFTFATGVIGIIGENGSGKSNIFTAIRLALTGYNSNSGNKAENIHVHAQKTATSYVQLVFEHNGTHVTVRRNLRPASPAATLTAVSGDSTVTMEGDTNVTTYIESLLGITSDVINDIVIVHQEDIFGFLSNTPAKRLEQFQKLFGTDLASVIHKKLNDHVRSVTVPATCVDIATLQNELHQVEQQYLQNAASPYMTMNTQTLLDELATITREIATIQQATQQSQRIQQMQQALESTQAQYADCSKLVADAQVLVDSLTSKTPVIDQAAADAVRAIHDAAEIRNKQVMWADFRKRVADATAVLTTVMATQPTALSKPVDDMQALRNQIAGLTSEISNAKKFLASFTSGVTECPTCHTPVTNLHSHISDTQKKLEQDVQKLAELQQQYDDASRHQRAVDIYNDNVTRATTQLESATTSLNAFIKNVGPLTDAVIDDGVNKAAIDAQSQHRAAVNDANRKQAAATARLTELQRVIAQTTDAITRESALLSQLLPSTHNVDELTTRERSTRELIATAQSVQQQQNTLGVQISQLQARIAEYHAVEAQAAKTREWIKYVERLRDLFAKEAAPRFVSQTNLQRLEVSINDILQTFNAPFRVQAADGLTFNANFLAGYSQPANRLSPGQKVLLALAFRLSLNLMFATNIGAMYLDEPTAWLDKQRIQCFGPVLQQLREFAASRGLQTVIITHESDLAPLFDATISP